MAEGDGAATVEAMGIRAARGEVVSDAFNGSQIGRLVIESKFACYSAHSL